MDATYPLGLNTIQSVSKIRSQGAVYVVGANTSTPETTGEDVPVYWDCALVFDAVQALTFRTWFDTTLDHGRAPFVLPIKTEVGIVDHTVSIDPSVPASVRHDGGVWTYTMRLMSRALNIDVTDAHQIITFYEYGTVLGARPYNVATYSSLLDQTINEEWPVDG
jgi:hypothetical protein